MLGIDCGQVTQVLGVQRTSAAVATIMFATIPIFVVIFAAWRLRQPLRIHHAIGLVLALGGIALVATQRLGGAGAQSVTAAGVVLIMISAVSIALYYVISAELSRHYPVTTVAAWSSLIGVVPLLPMTARGGVAAAGLTGAAIVPLSRPAGHRRRHVDLAVAAPRLASTHRGRIAGTFSR